MIRHIVLLRFKADIDATTRDALMRDLKAVVAATSGCGGFFAFENNSPEVDMVKGFAHGFVVDFDDDDARTRYLDDPAHRAVGARLVASAQGGAEGVLVVDYDLSAA